MRRVARLAVLAGMATLLGFATPVRSGMTLGQLLQPGDAAPPFTFADVRTGEIQSFDSVAPEAPLVLVFLQTACRSCVREMLALKKIASDVGPISVLGVFLDMKARDFQKYITDYDLPFAFTWDAGYATADAYGVSVTPVSFLIDRDRNVAAVYRGFHLGMEREIRRDLERLGLGR